MAPTMRRVLTVFLAGPSEVQPEKEVVQRLLVEINRIWAPYLESGFDLFRWETSTTPGVGVDAQDVINKQIPSEFDLFLGLIGKSLGSPTSRAQSGTVEELDLALERHRQSGWLPEVFLYLKRVDWRAGESNGQELRDSFICRLQKEGVLYSEFLDERALEASARLHLSLFLQRMSRKEVIKSPGLGGGLHGAADEAPARGQIGRAGSLMQEAGAELTNATEASADLREVMDALNQAMRDAHSRLQRAMKPGFRQPTGGLKGIVNRLAPVVVNRSVELAELSALMSRSYLNAVASMGRSVSLIALIPSAAVALQKSFEELRGSTGEARAQLEELGEQVGAFRKVIQTWPKASREMTDASSQLTSAVAGLEGAIELAVGKTIELERALAALGEDAS